VRKFLSDKNGYYVYLVDGQYIVQVDSGDHLGRIYQFTITEDIYNQLQRTQEEIEGIYKIFDWESLIMLDPSQGWKT